MAERRYSKEDQAKILKDNMNKLNARGADFQDCHVCHPDGTMGLVKEMKKDPGWMVAQSQEQTEKNRDIAKHINDPKEPQE
jgi:hypothetical protein